MHPWIRFLGFFIPTSVLAIWAAFFLLSGLEERWTLNDLVRRSRLISESTNDYLAENLKKNKTATVTSLINRISRDERLTGILICSPNGQVVTKSSAVPPEVQCTSAPLKSEEFRSRMIQVKGGAKLHEGVYPIQAATETVAYFVALHDTSYMNRRHATTKWYIALLLIGFSVSLFLLTLGVYRWTISSAIKKLKFFLKDLVAGDLDSARAAIAKSELSPLAKDLSRVMVKLRQAKNMTEASEVGPLWSPLKLRSEVQKQFGDSQICVIANREPYIHNRHGGKIEVIFPASGLVTAVEPIVRACSGLWIAHGSGTADRETADSSGKLLVPPEKPEYVLKRIWLSKTEEQGYYYGFSNEGLWPLCHIAHARPHFESKDWNHYVNVNTRFAESFAQEQLGKNPVVLIQDYHFALLPRMIRERKPSAVTSLFWHIPWPNPEAFGICPWKKELLLGMLGADLIGFHTQFHCNNFLDTIDRFLEARVDREQFTVTVQGHVCHVKPFPISIEWPPRHDIQKEDFGRERQDLLNELNLPSDIQMGIGVDRIDYTKGIVERLRSVERLLEKRPELVGKFTFVQIGAPSRTHIKRYQDLNSEVQELADRINWKFDDANVPPIILKMQHHNAAEIFKYYRAADLCFVSSLHDGMNLVAKEYVSARKDGTGVLILSNFTGAARELTDALLVNPYDLEECAGALHAALQMPVEEQKRRMERMRLAVSERNVYAWAGAFLNEIHRVSEAKTSV
jgi:trehalose 6-phosphate synthase